MSEINIGEKISQIRKSKDLSVRDLSKLGGVTASMLSQIERGIANPSVNSLKSIASALNVPLFTFFTSEVSKKDMIVRKENRKKVILPESYDVVYDVLAPDLTSDLEFAIMSLSTGSVSSSENIQHKGYEIAYLLEGEVNLCLDDEEFTLYQGDSVKIPAGVKHRWENKSNLNAKVIFAVIL